MRHARVLLLSGALTVSALSGPAQAAPDPGGAVRATSSVDFALDEAAFPGLAARISLDLRGMDVVEVLKFLSSKGNFNIVTGPEVQGRATLTLNDVSVKDALEIVLVSNGLAIERRGPILYVLSGQQYEQLYGHRYGDPRQSLILQLKYANPAQVGQLLSNVKSAVGRIVIDEPTATLAILDTPGVLTQMRALIQAVDLPTIQRQVPTVTRVETLQYAKAEDVKAQIDAALTPEIGQARLDKRSNALVITDVEARMPQIESLIKAFDARHRQVYIESSILSVTLSDEFDTGIQWSFLSESNRFPDVNITSAQAISSDAAAAAMKVIVGTLGENDVQVTMQALKTFGDTKVLSSPHIAVLNNEDARIHVGRREFYVTTTSTTGLSTGETAEQVNFIDIGVKLNVTPTISENGFINLKIRPEVSSVAEFRNTANGNSIPVVETSEAETRVMVKDGSTIIIGGLMKDDIAFTKQAVPGISRVPFLGALFRNRSDHIQKTELVILLTPHIITGEEMMAPSSTARVEWPGKPLLPKAPAGS